jgi:hypothetical protein
VLNKDDMFHKDTVYTNLVAWWEFQNVTTADKVPDSSVSIVTRLWAGRPGFDSRQGKEGTFVFATTFRATLGPI